MKSVRSSSVFASVFALAFSAQAEKPGMPQMDPTWFANQLVWLAISFALLYLIVSKLVVPRVGGVLATRASTIAEAIAAAEQFKATAAQTHSDYEQRAHAVHEQVAAMIANAQAEAAQRGAEALAKLQAEMETKEATAMQKLSNALKAAKPDLESATAEVARSMAEKLLGVPVDVATISTAIKAA